ncbi:MAG: Stf0 family sulfotransferase, partial [Proteobacteria bacterium]|nr:Stf0 family sulfotransferase [Pseudomonadota bacterium]
FLQLVEGCATHGAAGFKIGARQLFWLTRTGILSNLRSVRIINTVRHDKLAQAVSFCIARQTKVWHTALGDGTESAAYESENVEYSRDDLVGALHTLTMNQLLFDHYVNLHAVPAIQVEYEQVLAQPREEVERVMTFLNYTGADLDLVDIAGVGIRQQCSAVNDRMIAQFRRDFNGVASQDGG